MSAHNPWTTSAPIPGTQADSHAPALAIVKEKPHLAWTSNRVLYHACLTAEGWSSPVRVASGEQPTLAAAPDGRLHCLFANQFAGNYEIYHVYWDDGRWSLPQNVSRTRGASTHPVLAIAPDGALHAAWSDNTPGYSVIYHGQQREVFWSSVPIPNARGSMPALAITPNGDLYIAWQDRLSDTQRYDVFCSICHDGAWGIPELVSDKPEAHSLNPRLVTNVQGGCHMVWQEEEAGIYRVRHADRRPNSWARPVDVSETDADCRLGRIAANRQGFLQAVWLEGQALNHRVRSPEYDAPWWDPETVCSECQGLSDLALAISRAGAVHLVTCGFDGVGSRCLYYIQREPVFKQTTFIPIG
ncbi:MAG: hypothetical protein CVU38_17460 [Chloroflexi bacterium HGW-Chloroflexi-1]|nr:MAG: hypothetical protein CVU38_17460 [Chloroflexi bacterium HGW-Chloroflexi-1]